MMRNDTVKRPPSPYTLGGTLSNPSTTLLISSNFSCKPATTAWISGTRSLSAWSVRDAEESCEWWL